MSIGMVEGGQFVRSFRIGFTLAQGRYCCQFESKCEWGSRTSIKLGTKLNSFVPLVRVQFRSLSTILSAWRCCLLDASVLNFILVKLKHSAPPQAFGAGFGRRNISIPWRTCSSGSYPQESPDLEGLPTGFLPHVSYVFRFIYSYFPFLPLMIAILK